MKATSNLAIIILVLALIGVVSGAYTQRPTINATYTITTIPTNARFSNITTALHVGNGSYNGTPEWFTGISQTFYVLFDTLGPIALVVIFSLPFVMSYVSNKSLRITSVIGLIVSPFLLVFLPVNYAAAAGLCIIIAAAGLAWSVVKS